LVLSGPNVKLATVEPGTVFKRYIGKTDSYEDINIVESQKGEGFDQLEGCLAAIDNEEIIKGVILEQNNLIGIISGREKFKLEIKSSQQIDRQSKLAAESTEMEGEPGLNEPYLFITTNIPSAGEPVLGRDNIVHLFGTGFKFDPDTNNMTLSIDGQIIEGKIELTQDGSMKSDIEIPTILPNGKHTIKVLQKTQNIEISASGSFVKETIDDFEEKDREKSFSFVKDDVTELDKS
jgi:hypothetical protein